MAGEFPAATTGRVAYREGARPVPCPADPSARRPPRQSLPRYRPRRADSGHGTVLASLPALAPRDRGKSRKSAHTARSGPIRHGSGPRGARLVCTMRHWTGCVSSIRWSSACHDGAPFGARPRSPAWSGGRQRAALPPAAVHFASCSRRARTAGPRRAAIRRRSPRRASRPGPAAVPPDARSPPGVPGRRRSPRGPGPARLRTNLRLRIIARRQGLAWVFEVDHPGDELAVAGQLQVLLGDVDGDGEAALLIGGCVEPVDGLDGGKDFHALGQPNVRHAEPIHGPDQQAGLSRGRLCLVELVTDSQRNQGPWRGLDLNWLKEPGQWSAPLELPAANRSRRHNALMEIVHGRLLGRQHVAGPRQQSTNITILPATLLQPFASIAGQRIDRTIVTSRW